MADVVDQLVVVARALDAAAPPVELDEITSSGVTWSGGPGARRRWPPRRRWVVAGAAAAAAVVAVAIVVSSPRPTQVRTLDSVPVSTAAAPTTASASAPAPDPDPGTTVNATIPPATTVAPISAGDLGARVSTALAAFDSFRATTTRRSYVEGPGGQRSDETVTGGQLTLFADGRLWTTSADGGWSSYDPATGTGRVVFRPVDGGELVAQEVVGFEDNTLPLTMTAGHDPVFRFDGETGAITPTTTPDGGAGWTTTIADPVAVTTYVIDDGTGLVVQARRVSDRADGRSDVQESTYTGIATDVEMPAEFPGRFADGIVVERSGEPAAFSVVTDLAPAASTFGAGLLQPRPELGAARTTIADRPVGDGSGARVVTVTTTITDGFARTTIVQDKTILQPGVTASMGLVPVDDGACPSTDGVTCSPSTDPVLAEIDSGPRAGTTIFGVGDATRLTATRGSVHVAVTALTPDLAWDVMISLAPVP